MKKTPEEELWEDFTKFKRCSTAINAVLDQRGGGIRCWEEHASLFVREPELAISLIRFSLPQTFAYKSAFSHRLYLKELDRLLNKLSTCVSDKGTLSEIRKLKVSAKGYARFSRRLFTKHMNTDIEKLKGTDPALVIETMTSRLEKDGASAENISHAVCSMLYFFYLPSKKICKAQDHYTPNSAEDLSSSIARIAEKHTAFSIIEDFSCGLFEYNRLGQPFCSPEIALRKLRLSKEHDSDEYFYISNLLSIMEAYEPHSIDPSNFTYLMKHLIHMSLSRSCFIHDPKTPEGIKIERWIDVTAAAFALAWNTCELPSGDAASLYRLPALMKRTREWESTLARYGVSQTDASLSISELSYQTGEDYRDCLFYQIPNGMYALYPWMVLSRNPAEFVTIQARNHLKNIGFKGVLYEEAVRKKWSEIPDVTILPDGIRVKDKQCDLAFTYGDDLYLCETKCIIQPYDAQDILKTELAVRGFVIQTNKIAAFFLDKLEDPDSVRKGCVSGFGVLRKAFEKSAG